VVAEGEVLDLIINMIAQVEGHSMGNPGSKITLDKGKQGPH
jgi:hypothetical protein